MAQTQTNFQQFQNRIYTLIIQKLSNNDYNIDQENAILMFWGLSMNPINPTPKKTSSITHKKTTRTRTLMGITFNPIQSQLPNKPLHFPNINENNQRYNFQVIIGPPGTGKTTVIVTSALLAIAQPQYNMTRRHYIYIATSNNSASDRVLESFVDFFNENKILDGNLYVKRFRGDEKYFTINSYNSRFHPYICTRNALDTSIQDAQIFIGTIWQLKTLSNQFNTYPELIMFDETSQLTPPMIYVPMTHSNLDSSRLRGVCLIGDDMQLPPITTFTEMSINSLQFIMQYSNFSVQNIPRSRIITLLTQYRMHPAIRQIAEIFTPGRNLIDGPNTILPRHLLQGYHQNQIPTSLSNSAKSFIDEILNPQKTVIIIDTSNSDQEGSNLRVGGSRRNDFEINLVKGLITCIKSTYNDLDFTDTKTLKLISPYKAQAQRMKMLHPFAGTVDAFQGQESLIVIVSLAFNENQSSSHLSDNQRLHVMMSRAKSKLIIIGYKNILINQGNFRQVFNFSYSQSPNLNYNPVIIKEIDSDIYSEISII